MADEQFFLDAQGKVIRQAPAHREIRPFERTVTFVVDPDRPKGSKQHWVMLETTDGPPIMGRIYFPKYHRRMGLKYAIPEKLTLTVRCEYFQADPGPLGA